VEISLALLAHASMPLKYWDEAFFAAMYLINRTPTKLLSYSTLLQKLLGASPDYTNFRVFGCPCWPNLQPYNTHKLQLRSTRCVFSAIALCTRGLSVLIPPKGAYIFPGISSLMKPFSLCLLALHRGSSLLLRCSFNPWE
jgi:hypothetical protein